MLKLVLYYQSRVKLAVTTVVIIFFFCIIIMNHRFCCGFFRILSIRMFENTLYYFKWTVRCILSCYSSAIFWVVNVLYWHHDSHISHIYIYIYIDKWTRQHLTAKTDDKYDICWLQFFFFFILFPFVQPFLSYV